MQGKNASFKPDYELIDKQSGQSHCIIEVKRLLEKEDTYVDIKEKLPQQIKQLRTYCIHKK